MTRPTVVATLRELLTRAEAGEITGIAVACCTPTLCTASSWVIEEATVSELIGSVALMQWRMSQWALDMTAYRPPIGPVGDGETGPAG